MASRKTLTLLAAALLVGWTGCGDDETGTGPSIPGSAHFWSVRADSSGDYPTIQEALYHALPGDTVAVAQGTYFERPIIDKPVIFLGGWDNNFAAPDPDLRRTILDGRSLGTVLTILNVPDTSTVVRGFVIKGGGYAKVFDGGRSASDAPPGSGILCDHASPLISHNTIEENAAPYGAGIL